MVFEKVSDGFRIGLIDIINNITWPVLAPAIVYCAPEESKVLAAFIVIVITIALYLRDVQYFESASISTVVGYCFAICVANQFDTGIAIGMASPLIMVICVKFINYYSTRSN